MPSRYAAGLSLVLLMFLSPLAWSQTPQITQVSPASASSGTLVTIIGSGFGASQLSGSVSIGGAVAVVGTWSDTQIAAIVAVGAQTGAGSISVTNANSQQSNAFAFTVLPPNVFAGPVTYSYDELGRLVGAVAATGDSVKYSYDAVGNILAITRYSASQFAFFTFSPKSGPVGTSVMVSGSNFSSNPAQDTVTFNGTSATISSASATQLVVSVPSGATTGPLTISSPAGSVTTSESFTVTAAGGAPRIDSFTPQIAASASSVVLTGTNFDLLSANNRLVLNITPAAIPTGVTSAGMTMTVPAAAGSGHIALANPGGTTISTGDLFVPPSPFTPAQVGYTGRTNLGVATTTSIATANKIGLLLFEGVAGHNVSVASSSTTFSICTFQIYKPDNTALSTTTASCSSSSFLDSKRLPITGTYALLINASTGSAGGATFTIYDSTEIAATLTPGGSPFTITTTAPGQNARLSFFGNQNQHVSITLSGSTFTNCSLYVYNPDSTVLVSATSCTASNTFVEVPYLSERGVYTILVDPGTTQTGTLTVKLNDATDITGTVTAGGASATATIATPGQNARYTFAGSQNQHVSLSILSSTFTNCTVSIIQPDGTSSVNNGSCTNTSSFVEIPSLSQSGSYTILVDPSGGATGAVTLKLNDATDITGTIPTDGTQVTVNIATPGQNAKLTFSGTAGQQISAIFQNVNMANGVSMVLLDPSGAQVNSGGNIGISTVFMDDARYCVSGVSYLCGAITLPTTGTYTVSLDPVGSGIGQVKLSVYNVPADTVIASSLGASQISVPLNVPGQNTKITFAGTAGGRVGITFGSAAFTGSAGSVGFKLQVLLPDGTPFTGSNGGAFSFSSPTSGFVDYNDIYSFPTTGTYTLTLDPLNDSKGTVNVNLYDATDVSLAINADGSSHSITTTAPGQNAHLNFTPTIGQRISALLTGGTYTNLPSLILRRVDGTGSVFNTSFGGTDGANVFMDAFTISQTGTYFLFVDPSSTQTGSATISLYTVTDLSGTVDPAGTPLTATITTPGQNGAFTFSANSGQSVTLTTSSTNFSSGRCMISIVNPSGSNVGNRDCANIGSTSWTVTQTGVFKAVIDPTQSSTGNATFNVRVQ